MASGAAFRSGLLKSLDGVRALAGSALGLRRLVVTVRVRTWNGSRPGAGTKVDVDTVLRAGGQNVKVVQVSQKDVIASGGAYTDQRYKVGPCTPPFPGGGVAYSTLDPAASASPTEIFWKISGDGLPAGGAWFDRVGDEDTSLHSYVILQANGRQPGT